MSVAEASEDVIARSFLDWSNEEVLQWLATLSLSQDHSEKFRAASITGVTLLQLSPSALDDLGITDISDRVKLLQNLTTMRADLVISSHIPSIRRHRSPMKTRRFSETVLRPGPGNTSKTLTRQSASSSSVDRATAKPLRYEPRASPRLESPARRRDLLRLGSAVKYTSPMASRMGSPVKGLGSPTKLMHYVIETEEEGGSQEGEISHKRYLSRSMDGLCQATDNPHMAVRRCESTSTKLLEILKEENANLKRELEAYYQRVRKLQRLEQELERIREGHRLLEVSSARKEKLEAAMRYKLEGELRRLKEANLQQRAELHRLRRGKGSTKKEGAGPQREIQRRDTMIMRLIKQNKDQAIAREKLEKDLHTMKTALQFRERTLSTGDSETDSQEWRPSRPSSEAEDHATSIYAESIEKLRSVLMAMQTMSQKRERLERQVRSQLEAEIHQLKGAGGREREGERGEGGTKAEVMQQARRITALEADVAKWEHKCLELVAEKQMSLEATLVPCEARISHLERVLAQSEDAIDELHLQKSQYLEQLSDANKMIAELQTSVSSLQASIKEKDTVIRMMQQSFLEPDTAQEPLYSTLHGSRSYFLGQHGSPVSAKKLSKSGRNGSQLSLAAGSYLAGSLGEIPVHLSGSPPTISREVCTSSTAMVNGGMVTSSTEMNGVGHPHRFPTSLSYGSHLHQALQHPAPHGQAHKPRISHPVAVLDTANTVSAPIIFVPVSSSPGAMNGKSKTPPPDYRAVRIPSRGKKRHGSVGTTLEDEGPYGHPPTNGEILGLTADLSSTHSGVNGHLEFFESLIGNGVGAPKAFLNSTYGHKHSSSSPTYTHRLHL